MKICIVQNDIAWADKETNLLLTEKIISNLSKNIDLVVLPELFTTGFCPSELHLAEDMNGITVKRLLEWSDKYHVAICGSFLARDSNNNYYNRAFFTTPNQDFHYADKRHLFALGDENHYLTSGEERLMVSYKGFNIAVLVCYDIRFPVWSRNQNNEYDLLIYVANFPAKRIQQWDTLLKARAIENQAFVCGVNRVGTDANAVAHSGHSAIYNFKGETLLSFTENEMGVETVCLQKEELEHYRERFPFWKDNDDFHLI